MKVLLVNGSPNEAGCTFTALAEVAGALERGGVGAEFFHIGKKAVHGCIACRRCAKLGHCVLEGDLCNNLMERMQAVDGVVIGSPVYYAGPNGALCALLDRAFYAGGGAMEGKLAAAVVSCRRGGASAAFDRLNKYFTISGMPVASSQYWNAVHGNTPEEVCQDLEGLQIMRTLGNNMAWLLNCVEKAGLPAPKREEPREYFNFIR